MDVHVPCIYYLNPISYMYLSKFSNFQTDYVKYTTVVKQGFLIFEMRGVLAGNIGQVQCKMYYLSFFNNK